MKIISASRRTDIPAFHTPWLIDRISEGSCVYPNPMFPNRLHRVSLRPEDVSGFFFWTRDAMPLLPHLTALEKTGFACCFLYTVVGYPAFIDPRTPPVPAAISTIRELSERLGADAVVWRYDPILLCRELPLPWHQDNLRKIADGLAGHVSRLIVSVVDPYPAVRRRLADAVNDAAYDPDSYGELLAWIVSEANARGISVQSCTEPRLRIPGLEPGGCIDGNRLRLVRRNQGRNAAWLPERFPLHRGQRKGCLCHHSVDIGTNGTCGFGCRYCYAT